MSILIVIITSVLATSHFVVDAIDTPKITREHEITAENSHYLAIDANLLHVSHFFLVNNEEWEVYWNVTNIINNTRLCLIQPHPMHQIYRTNRAAPLDHKIILWSDGYSKSSGNSKLTNYEVILVDTKKCAQLNVFSLDDNIPNSDNLTSEVVTRRDKFDFYYPSRTECSPCTFDSNGNETKLTQQLRPQNVKSQFYVRWLDKIQRSVAVYQLFNESIVVTSDLFDESLSSRNSRLLEFNTKLIAVTDHSMAPYIGVITAFPTHQPKIPIYTVFDDELNTVFEVYPPLLDGCIFDNALANIDSLGNSYVTLIQKEKQGKKHIISLVRYDVNGHLINQYLLDVRDRLQTSTLECEDQALLVGNEEYCLIIHKSNRSEIDIKTSYVKCIDVSG